MAVAADMGMSLIVTLNGLRLLRRDNAGPARVSDAEAGIATAAVGAPEGCSCCVPLESGDEATAASPKRARAGVSRPT
jgi:hypothetical protein